MKFLIQKIDGEVRHDFSLTLLESLRFQKWLQGDKDDTIVKYLDSHDNEKEDWNWLFKDFHKNYVPVGSVEFVTAWFKRFYDHYPRPINVPEELFDYCDREIVNGDEATLLEFEDMYNVFVKSNDKIKGFTEIIDFKYILPKGNYQISELVDIDSEWRAFVYQSKLVGLQNYSGEFTMFPDVHDINGMIDAYKSAPIAYTLDVGVFDEKTFVIECHPMMSVGLYGFSDHKILPYMFYRAFKEITNKL